MATDLGLTAARIAPDGIAELRLGRTDGIAFVEADAGTETAALRNKLERYAAFVGDRKGLQLWLMAAGGPARLATVEAWCEAAGVAGFTRVFPAADLLVRPAMQPVARLHLLRAARSPERGDGGAQ